MVGKESGQSTARDVFLHLLATITLYISVISFLTVVFQYVNVLIPDPLVSSQRAIYDLIRGASSSLIVAFPIYLLVTSIINRDSTKHPQKRDLGIRKWLTYLTLLIAAITIIVYLIQLVNGFYGGELSTAFALKVLAVLLVTGGVFYYYLWDIRAERVHVEVARQLAWASGSLVTVVIVAGFFIAGSPAEQRQVRFDDQRVEDLSLIQGQVLQFWQQKDRLPTTLDELEDPISGFTLPIDPESEQAYEYRAQGELMFELCATFATRSLDERQSQVRTPVAYDEFGRPLGGLDSTWHHAVGRECFERTIDPELYSTKER